MSIEKISVKTKLSIYTFWADGKITKRGIKLFDTEQYSLPTEAQQKLIDAKEAEINKEYRGVCEFCGKEFSGLCHCFATVEPCGRFDELKRRFKATRAGPLLHR